MIHSTTSRCAILLTALVAAVNCQASEVINGAGGGPLWLLEGGQAAQDNFKISQEAGASSRTISTKLDELITKRVGPIIRASSDYRDFQDIELAESVEAWRQLHERASSFAQVQAHHFEPELKRLLNDANVSMACQSASTEFFAAVRRLDAWAVQMWSATGNFPPAGLFDGRFTDLGSYRGCIDIERPRPTRQATVGGDNYGAKTGATAATELEYATNYCMIGFRPVVPSRKRFHQIYLQEAANLTQLFAAADIFHQATQFAQYFHYFYTRQAVCVPVECSARDIQQVSRLIGQKLALMPAPVKCLTRSNRANGAEGELQLNSTNGAANTAESIEQVPLLVNVNEKLNGKQWVALVMICSFFALVFLITGWHALEIARDILLTSKYSIPTSTDDDNDNGDELIKGEACSKAAKQTINGEEVQVVEANKTGISLFKLRCFYYLSMITNGREFLDTRVRSNEIHCLHGFRVITMFWIVCVHTLQYNEWSGFNRVFENVATLRNPFVQPLINANYVVDNFFLMSGLLAAYTIWNANKGASTNFSPIRCLIGRYLRLTPQVLLISLAYMLLPSLSNGPFWFEMTHYAGKYCEQNWWLNLLHVQSFFREQEMCNLVGWWISVDMFFYAVGLMLLWMILNKRLSLAMNSTLAFLAYCTLITAWRHYAGGFTPNNLGSVPQIGEVWSEFVTYFYWSPYPHAFVFFLGLWLGYALANNFYYHQIRRWSKLGWILSSASLIVVNYSSRLWITGTLDHTSGPQFVSTAYNIVCVIVWACAFGWMIVACHYGCAPSLNRYLSTGLSIMLSKASFIIYLSHMLILRAFFGSQYDLIEVSLATILILLVGMCFLSILFGVFLCIAFEGPCLKFQRFVLKKITPTRRQLPIAGSAHLFESIQVKEVLNSNNNNNNNNNTVDGSDKHSLNMGPTSVTLLK